MIGGVRQRQVSGSLRSPLGRARAYARDAMNIARFGLKAPRYAELIWIDPTECRFVISGRFSGARGFGAANSGKVITDDWPAGVPVETLMPVVACTAHFRDGVSWAQTGIFEYNEANHRRPRTAAVPAESLESSLRRPNKYASLDIMFEQIKSEGRLRTQLEIEAPRAYRSKRDPGRFREEGGILVHVGPNGQLFFGGKGCNRFAIALVLGLRSIPAQLGCVHVSAISYLDRLRTPAAKGAK